MMLGEISDSYTKVENWFSFFPVCELFWGPYLWAVVIFECFLNVNKTSAPAEDGRKKIEAAGRGQQVYLVVVFLNQFIFFEQPLF